MIKIWVLVMVLTGSHTSGWNMPAAIATVSGYDQESCQVAGKEWLKQVDNEMASFQCIPGPEGAE